MLNTTSKLSKPLGAGVALITVALVGLSLDINKVEAATITQARTISVATTDWDETVNFNLFNPSFGTLNSVTVKLTGIVTGDGYLINNNQEEDLTTGTFSLSARLALLDPTDPDGVAELAYVQPIQNDTLSPTRPVAAGETRIYAPVTFSAQNSFNFTSSDSIFGSFIGLGSISFGGQGYGYSGWDGDSNVEVSFNTLAGVTYEVTYDYTGAVPEPMTILGAGVAAAFGTAFKRRSLRSKKNSNN